MALIMNLLKRGEFLYSSYFEEKLSYLIQARGYRDELQNDARRF
ncbi:hypothetical protein [Pyrococcus kukulkanii]|uniref:Uncharacterized protein n=1 Tax=Pyrococcus kukulkanii TaxID=1609559 RepID=A0ABV4T5G7_9EURY